MTEELRCYTFTLYQLSSIQQGIQAGHAAVELGMKAYHYQMRNIDSAPFRLYHEWATAWKTMVLLNGGDLNELREFADFLVSAHHPYPWAAFFESEESLGGLMTSLAIILPKRIFDSASKIRTGEVMPFIDPPGESYTPWEWDLILKIASRKLAQ